MIIDTENLLTVRQYAEKTKLTPMRIYQRANLGLVEVIKICGIKFVVLSDKEKVNNYGIDDEQEEG